MTRSDREGRRIMETNGSIRTLNRRLALKVRREGKQNPKSPYARRYVGIANGEVVVIADSLDDVSNQLRKIEPDNKRSVIVDLVGDYERVYEV